jgi:glycerol uptake facilitator-like aquaporin
MSLHPALALVTWDWEDQWIYWLGDFAGAVLATVFYFAVYVKGYISMKNEQNVAFSLV